MAKLTPQEAREKHARRLKGAAEDMRKGVDRVNEAPGKRAAEKQEKMRENLIRSIDSGDWARRVAAVPLEEWRSKMRDKGIPRVAAGIDGAAGKMEDFFGQLFDHQDRLQDQVDSMPDLTLEDNINRMVTFIRGMSEFKRE